MLPKRRSHHNETPEHKNSTCLLQLEKAYVPQWIHRAGKNKYIQFFESQVNVIIEVLRFPGKKKKKDFLVKGMATHSSTLAWKTLWMEDPGRLQSMGSQSRTRLSDFTFTLRFIPTMLQFILFIIKWHDSCRWTWVWASSRRWWWTGKHGVPQSMGSQRVRHDWVTELNWTDYQVSCPLISHNWSFESKLFLKSLNSLSSINLLVINSFTPYLVVI